MLELIKRIKKYAQTQPHQQALDIDNEQLTYQSLWQAVCRQSDSLPRDLKHQRIGLCHRHMKDFIIAYLAVLLREGWPCVLASDMVPAQRDKICHRDAIVYVWDEEGMRRVAQTATQHDSHSATSLLHIGYTSGTTGLPKGFMRDEASWKASFEMNDLLMEEKIEAYVALGPYAHSLTLYVMVYALWNGKVFIGQNRYHCAQMLLQIETCQYATALFLVPTMVYDWVQSTRVSKWVRHIFISGDKLAPVLHRQLSQVAPQSQIDEFFGTSEASFISVNRQQSAPLTSVGQLFPTVEVKLKDKDNSGVGTLWVKSPMTFAGYLGEPYHQGWLQTGDYARMEGQTLYLHGRLGDRLIIGGKNVYPAVIEQHLKHYPGLIDVTIVRRPHSKLGELAIALYVATSSLDEQQLRQWLATRVSRYEIPSKFIRVSHLPLTASGKVTRAEAQRRYERGDYS